MNIYLIVARPKFVLAIIKLSEKNDFINVSLETKTSNDKISTIVEHSTRDLRARKSQNQVNATL